MLRLEIAEWEDKFEARVHEEVAWRTEIECELRAKIDFLESQLQGYACRIKELERARELQAHKLRRAESLRLTNRNLERRIDVLTQLLAQPAVAHAAHPEQPEQQSPPLLPMRSPGPRLTRPRTMLLSPRPHVDGLPPHHPPALAGSNRSLDGYSEAAGGRGMTASGSPSPDSPAMASSTSSSSASSKSRWSSPMSRLSSVSSQWSVPLPFPFESPARKPRPRSIRRFPSGSCTLKPLILPSAATPCPEHQPRRSRLLSSDLYPSPLFPQNSDTGLHDDMDGHDTHRSQAETLAALEGRPRRQRLTFNQPMRETDDDGPGTPLLKKLGPTRNRYSRVAQTASIDESRASFTLFSPARETGGLGIYSEPPRGPAYHSPSVTPVPPAGSRRRPVLERRSKKSSTSVTHSRANRPSRGDRVPSRTPTAKLEILTAHQLPLRVCGRVIQRLQHGSVNRLRHFSWSVLNALLGPRYLDEWQNTPLFTTRVVSLAAALVVMALDVSPWSRSMEVGAADVGPYVSRTRSMPLATIYSCGRTAGP